MKVGDFVSVHLEDGCCVGILESIDGDFVAVSFKMTNGDRAIMSEIPKKYCSLYVSV